MKFSDVTLPSNRKFGFFFSAVFIIIGSYFYIKNSAVTSLSLLGMGFLFFIITLVKADVLLPLNKLWMRFGLFLGMIVSPIVLGIIFFGLFTPIGIIMRLFGRDELRLRKKNKASHWIVRDSAMERADAFKHQF